MKQQSSLNLKINDNPVNSNALENSLMLRATNSGLKLFNSVGEELPICSSVFKVQEFPTSGMIENSIYILESGEAKAYFSEGWIDISQEVVETIDDSASNDNIPTTKAVKDYVETNKLNVNSYNSISKINFKNARVNLESTSGGIVDIDTSMNVENESIDNLGNPLILRGDFLGNSENTILLYTGDNTEIVSNNITTLTNIALNKDYLGDITTYNTSNILTYDNVPPIYGQNSEGHKSFGMDISDKDIKIQYTNSFSEYVKVSYWYYISSGTKISKTSYFELGTNNGDHMGIFYYDVASNKIKFLGNYTKTLIVSIEKDKWHYVELCLKLNEKNKAKVYHDGNYIGEETSTTINSWNNNDGQILFRSFIKNAFNFDQLMVNTSNEEEYNNFENTEHPIPTSASEVIKSTSFVINDIDNIPEDGKLFIKSKNQIYTIQSSLIALKTEINNPEQKTEVTTNAITFKKDISIYKIEINEATTFTFDFSQLDENNCYTFELWVSMSTPVTLTFPSDVAWLNDEVPDMSEASTYCIVVRKLPSTMGTSTITSPKALLNLAYQYALTLG